MTYYYKQYFYLLLTIDDYCLHSESTPNISEHSFVFLPFALLSYSLLRQKWLTKTPFCSNSWQYKSNMSDIRNNSADPCW